MIAVLITDGLSKGDLVRGSFCLCLSLSFSLSLLEYFSLLLFKYSCLHFLPTPLPHPTHAHLPPSILPTFGFVHVSFIHVPSQPFPFFSPSFPHSPELISRVTWWPLGGFWRPLWRFSSGNLYFPRASRMILVISCAWESPIEFLRELILTEVKELA